MTTWQPSVCSAQPVRLAHSPGPERRRADRHPCNYRTTCQPIALLEAVGVPVFVRDISTSGIGLVCRAPVPAGMFFAIELQNSTGGESLRLRARVVHATRKEDRGWLIGCRFTRDLSPEELTALL